SPSRFRGLGRTQNVRKTLTVCAKALSAPGSGREQVAELTSISTRLNARPEAAVADTIAARRGNLIQWEPPSPNGLSPSRLAYRPLPDRISRILPTSAQSMAQTSTWTSNLLMAALTTPST